MLWGMPNQPKTPLLAVRVDQETQDALKKIAAAEGRSVSDVVRDALQEFLATH